MPETALAVKDWFLQAIDKRQETPPDQISEEDHREDVRVSKDTNPVHSDREMARQAGYPNVVIRGKLAQGRAETAIAQVIYAHLNVPMLALKTTESWDFGPPMFLGETMITEFTITEAKLSSYRGKIKIHCRLIVSEKPVEKNVVQEGSLSYLLRFFQPVPADPTPP